MGQDKNRHLEPGKTRQTVDQYNFAVKKKYGQNFLTDPGILARIADGAAVGPEDIVLEIGPGFGALTKVLAQKGAQVAAVEIDYQLIPILNETLALYENIQIIQGDILKIDLDQLLQRLTLAGKKVKVVANLPYYITTPVIMRLLEYHTHIQQMTVMVQKEVAERLDARPSTKEYGALTLAVGYFANTKYLFTVPPGVFHPKPKVDSAVIQLDIRLNPPVETRDSRFLFLIIKSAFGQRRKTLVNAVYNSGVTALSKEALGDCLEAIGLSPTIRGEALSLGEFASFTDTVLNRQL